MSCYRRRVDPRAGEPHYVHPAVAARKLGRPLSPGGVVHHRNGDRDKIVFLIHLSETLRANERVVAQVEDNPREDALQDDLPQEALKAATNAMNSHRALAMELLRQDGGQRELRFGPLYDLLANPGRGRKLLGHRGPK